MTDLHTVEKPEYQIESTETELDQDELVWQAKIDELFEQIISWLAPFKGLIECKVISISLNNFEAFLEDSELPTLPIRKKSILRIIFPSGKYAELHPLGPYVMGNNYEEYFAKVTLRLNNRRFVIVMMNEGDIHWECAEYLELHEPLRLTPFNPQILISFLL